MAGKGLDDDSTNDVTEKFREAMGSGTADGVRTHLVDQKTGERSYLGKRSITNDDFDLFISQLQQDYPKGGKFVFALVDAHNKVLSNSSIILAPLPDAQQPKAERAPAPATAAPEGMDFMKFMMLQQQRSDEERRRSEDQSNKRFELILETAGTILAATLPKMLDRRGGRDGESPLEILNALLDAKEKIMPREGDDPFDKTLDRMAKMKTVMGDGGGGGEGGLLGLAKEIAPGLIQLATATAANAPALPNPAPRPQIAAPGQPVQAPTAANPLDQYRPLMGAIKVLLERQQPPDVIATYIDVQIRTGALSLDAMQQLYAQLQAAPAAFLSVLSMYGITSTFHTIAVATALAFLTGCKDDDELRARWASYGIVPGPEHAALVETCVGYFTDELDDDAEGGGMERDGADSAPNGLNGSGGIDHTANPPVGDRSNPPPATA